jgi:hypothetical protein
MSKGLVIASLLTLIILISGCAGNSILSSEKEVTGLAVASMCVDNDKGLAYDVKSYVIFEGEDFHDRCYDDDTVIEYYCKDDAKVGRKHICDSGCYEGVCAEIVEEIILEDGEEMSSSEEIVNTTTTTIETSQLNEVTVDLIKGDCVCTQQLNPACGTDGLTYYNACHARCLGSGVRYKGECDSTVDKPAEVAELNGTLKCTKDSVIYFVKNKYLYFTEEDGRERAYSANGAFSRGFDSRKWVYNAHINRVSNFYQEFLKFSEDVCKNTGDVPEDFEEFLKLYS